MAWAKKQEAETFNKEFVGSQLGHVTPGQQTERNILQKQKTYLRGLYCFGAVANFFVYQAFMTGIYNYRTRELLNMKRVPLPLKLAVSLAVSGGMCRALYNDSLYDE